MARRSGRSETGKLLPDSPLSGHFVADEGDVDLAEVMQVIEAAREEDALRRARRASEDADEQAPRSSRRG